MFCPNNVRRIPAAPDFGPLHGDVAFAELWALKRAFLDMAAYGVYDLGLLLQPVETLMRLCHSGRMTPDEQRRAITALEHLGAYLVVPLHARAMEAVARSCGEVAPGADDEGGDDACADEVGVEARAGSCGGPAPRDDQRSGGDASSATEGAASRNGEANTALDDAISGDTAGDCDDLEAKAGMSRDDEDAAAVKKRNKTRHKRRKQKIPEHRDTRLTPDVSERIIEDNVSDNSRRIIEHNDDRVVARITRQPLAAGSSGRGSMQ